MRITKLRKVGAALERRRVLRSQAMPEVKRLVKRFGRSTIAACLGALKEHEKSLSKLAALKQEVAKLEKDI